ncbi:glycosyltransferase [Bacillus cereus group sp. RP43]|uniref:glycosyltransferase family 2 protein n=1 Tax=Bacillus cereus group sp. RP43 TaxID=3040260 RepID=UPI00339B8C04
MDQSIYNDELVSVIMPCYNPNSHIKEAIESVLLQTYTNLELLIIDDGSTESVQEFIEDYLIDKRVRFIKQSRNQGVAITRNIGLQNSKGRYIAFLDSDDLWFHEKLEQQLELMKMHQAGLVYSAYEVIRNASDNVINVIWVPKTIKYRNLLKNTIIGCLTVLIDREKTGNIKMPVIPVGEDTATWLNILKKGHMAYGIEHPLAKYRVSGSSLSGNKWNMAKGTWKMYRKTQHLSFFSTGYYFSFYAFNATLKRVYKRGNLL